MARECVVCGKSMGILNGKVIISDGAVCNKCWSKTGLGSDMNSLMNAGNYNSKQINDMVKGKENEKVIAASFRATKSFGNVIDFDDNSNIVLVYTYSGLTSNSDYIKYSQIVNFELLEDGETISKGGLGRAIVGGALFGGVGAIVGGVTGSKRTKDICKSLQIKITVRDGYKQTIYVPFVQASVKTSGIIYKQAYKNAQDTLSALQLAMEKVNENKPAETISSADEIVKFKKLLDDGIITQEEFDLKKKQLLNL